jgi:hypothetical protein
MFVRDIPGRAVGGRAEQDRRRTNRQSQRYKPKTHETSA